MPAIIRVTKFGNLIDLIVSILIRNPLILPLEYEYFNRLLTNF
jgi:hypothetical protein